MEKILIVEDEEEIACGLVTSCMSIRSMYSKSGAPSLPLRTR